MAERPAAQTSLTESGAAASVDIPWWAIGENNDKTVINPPFDYFMMGPCIEI